MDQSNNELLNYGLPVLYCEIHKSNFIIKGCMDSNCKKRILLCVQCLNDHNNHTELLLDLPQFLDSFITSLKLKTSLQDQDILKNDKYQENIKDLHDDQFHLDKFKDFINNQKFMIAQEITVFYENILNICKQLQNDIFGQLDKMNDQYQQLYRQTQDSYLELFSFSSQQYYMNYTTMFNKIAALGPQANEVREYYLMVNSFQ